MPPHDAAALLFMTAKEAAKRARDRSDTLGEQTEVMTAVILCVAVAEASINAIGDWFEFHRRRPPFSISHGLPLGFDRLELRTKWSLLPLVVRQRTFDPAAEPWQSFDSLVELRNFIVHLRRRPVPKGLAALLKAKKLAIGGNLFCFEVARWACDTIAEMFEKLTELVDPPDEWIDFLWRWTATHSFPRGLATPGDPDYRRPGPRTKRG